MAKHVLVAPHVLAVDEFKLWKNQGNLTDHANTLEETIRAQPRTIQRTGHSLYQLTKGYGF